MNRREFIKIGATATAAAMLPKSIRAEETTTAMPPNILFLYTDEQRTDTLACYGNKAGIMPHVDQLAAQSTVFDRAYCTQPVCTPSRGSIVTGLYSHAHGAYNNNDPLHRDVKCLPEYLPAGVYATGHFGKWHLGDEIFPQHGFQDWRGTEDTYHKTYSPPVKEFGPERSTYHHWLIKHGAKPLPPRYQPGDPKYHPVLENRFFRDQIHALPEELSRPFFLAEQAIEFIQTNKTRPWALYVNFLEPHPPFTSCRDKQYSPADVTLAPNWQETLDDSHPERLVLSSQRRKTETELRETTARYWGMCNLVDTHVARILKALDDQGLRDNTIIVFTTDHGEMMGSFGLMGKSYMFEESSRVPLLVQLPGQQQQRRVASPVSQIDLTPTLLDLVGQKVPGNLHGASLRPQLMGKTSTTGRDVFIQWGTGPIKEAQTVKTERTRSIVTRDQWKFNRNGLGRHELYDLNTDPLERRNLVADPGQKERVAELQERITAWQKQVGDAG